MNNCSCRLLAFLILLHSTAFSQKLKKSDRIIVSNIQTHVNALSGNTADQEYVSAQFARWGLKPKGDTNTFYQQFDIYDGKDILPETHFTINNQKLKIFDDYFPFGFSANKRTEAAVSVALAERGVPWFKDIRELTDDIEGSAAIDTAELIRTKAKHAAEKGATALIIYSSSGKELAFDKNDRSSPVDIPVLYLKKKAFKKYCPDESAIIDVDLNVALKEKIRAGSNIIGYSDNHADSTIVTTAHLDRDTDVAALIELTRLLKNTKKKQKNYLFIAYCGENNGELGIAYFKEHPSVNLLNVNYSFDLDTVTTTSENPKGLFLVKRSFEIIKSN